MFFKSTFVKPSLLFTLLYAAFIKTNKGGIEALKNKYGIVITNSLPNDQMRPPLNRLLAANACAVTAAILIAYFLVMQPGNHKIPILPHSVKKYCYQIKELGITATFIGRGNSIGRNDV